MKKRQKYDPRKAIEEAKKNQDYSPKFKSAFPDGMLNTTASQNKEEKDKPTIRKPKIEENEAKN